MLDTQYHADVHEQAERENSLTEVSSIPSVWSYVQRLLKNILPEYVASEPKNIHEKNILSRYLRQVEIQSGLTVSKPLARMMIDHKDRMSYSNIMLLIEAALSEEKEKPPFVHDFEVHDAHHQKIDEDLSSIQKEIGDCEFYKAHRLIDGMFYRNKKPIRLRGLSRLVDTVRLKSADVLHAKLPLQLPYEKSRYFPKSELVHIVLEATALKEKKVMTKEESISANLIQKTLKRNICNNGIIQWRRVLLRIFEKLDIESVDITDAHIEKLLHFFWEKDLSNLHAIAFALKEKGLEQLRELLRYISPRNYEEEELQRAMAHINAGGSCAPPL